MIPFIIKAWKKFWMDEAAAARVFRGFLLWTGGMAVSVLAFPYDDVVTWTTREWLYRVAAAAALGFAGLISAGQRNPSPEQIKAELDKLPLELPKP